jgi:hypothetical protein
MGCNMDLIAEIERLQRIERIYNNIQSKLPELAEFIAAWDSQDPDQLPLCHKAKINLVRSVYNFCYNDGK